MKKILICIIAVFGLINIVNAEHMPDIRYKNIGIKDKITYDTNTNIWSKSGGRKNNNYYVKTKGFGDFYDYLDSNKDFAFTTNCEYEFLYKDSLIGFSNLDMKFYEIIYDGNAVSKRALTIEEVQQILPDYTVIPLSKFSEKTNSLKIKKNLGSMKIFLYNDTNSVFDKYAFSSGNAKFEQFDLRGFLVVYKAGMIQFFDNGTISNALPYVLLIR